MNNNGIKQEKNKEFLLTYEDLVKHRVTDKTVIKAREDIISINGERFCFCANEEMSFISGKPKSGKTSVASVMLSVCLAPNPTFDTLGIVGKYCEGKDIIYIDSEQSQRSSKQIINRVKRNLSIDTMPENLFVYNFRHFEHQELRKAFEVLLKHHQGAFLWFLDGISDMVKSVNNKEEAKNIIHYLNTIPAKEKTALILFLHENSTSSSDKMRGHLGSEAQRKCFATISVSKDKAKEIHCIKSVENRECGNFPDSLFRFDEDARGMKSLSGDERKQIKGDESKENELWDLASVLELGKGVTHTELKKKLTNYKGFSEATAKSRISKMLDFGCIGKEDLLYFLKPLT